MRNILLGTIASIAILSSGCLNNGTIEGTMSMKCYYDQGHGSWTLDTANETWSFKADYYTRHVFQQFDFDLATDPEATSVGRINVENELQVTSFVECDGNCRQQCVLPSDAVLMDPPAPPYDEYPDNPEYADYALDGLTYDDRPVDLERLTVHIVAGRDESQGTSDEDRPMYTPAYYRAKGFTYDASGACLTGDALDDLYDVVGNRYGDRMAIAVAQLNLTQSGFYSNSAPTYNAENDCPVNTWAQITVDNPDGVVRRGDVTGSLQLANFEIRNGESSPVLIDINGGGDFQPATFSIEGLLADSPPDQTVVTANNDPYDLGL